MGSVLGGKVDMRLPRRDAFPSNHLDDIVDLDQEVVNKELSLWAVSRASRDTPHSTFKTAKARFWPWFSGKNP
jgi:hypothetical protein